MPTVSELSKKSALDRKAERAKEAARKCLECTRPAHQCVGGSIETCGIKSSCSKMPILIQDSCGVKEDSGADMIISASEYAMISKAAEKNGISRRRLTRSQKPA